MDTIQNFFTVSRVNTQSRLEQAADLLLTPISLLCGGKQIFQFHNNTVHTEAAVTAALYTSNECLQLAILVAAVVLLPFAVLGAIVKLFLLLDEEYRTFCTLELSECHRKLYEMYQHIHSTAQFVTENRVGDYLNLNFTPLPLHECACCNTGAYHRLNSPRRNNMENAIVQKFVNTPPDKNPTIRLLSMGSGGLMSDFFLLEKLVLAGFKSITMDCVDPEIDLAAIRTIQQFFASCPDVTIQIQGHKDIADVYPQSYNAVIAIDYDNLGSWGDSEKNLKCASDLMEARRRLDAAGFLALGFAREDVLFSQKIEVQRGPSLIQNISGDLSQQLPSKEELAVALLKFDLFGYDNIFLFSLALAIEKAEKRYRKIVISCIDPDYAPPNNLANMRDILAKLFQKDIEIRFQKDHPNAKYDLILTGFKDVFTATGIKEDVSVSGSNLLLLHPQAAIYALCNNGSLQRQIQANEQLCIYTPPPIFSQ